MGHIGDNAGSKDNAQRMDRKGDGMLSDGKDVGASAGEAQTWDTGSHEVDAPGPAPN